MREFDSVVCSDGDHDSEDKIVVSEVLVLLIYGIRESGLSLRVGVISVRK